MGGGQAGELAAWEREREEVCDSAKVFLVFYSAISTIYLEVNLKCKKPQMLGSLPPLGILR